MKIEECLFSVIIPAFNEENSIAQTLQAIRKFPPPNPYEIIVVDNGSTDTTADIANHNNALVIFSPDTTIAAVRNRGVKASKGRFLIFLDADVQVTKEWHVGMPDVLNKLNDTPIFVTGSRCLPPSNSTWLNQYWFSLLNIHKGKYINSGHLITSRLLFDLINGFSETLSTAEDYDFCMKAHAINSPIIQCDAIPVIHVGYPTSISGFINRERWHGREDFMTMRSFVQSKVAWVAAFNLFLFTTCATLTVLLTNIFIMAFYFALMYMISFTLSVVKFRSKEIFSLVNTAIVFYLYITGRTISLLDRIISGVNN